MSFILVPIGEQLRILRKQQLLTIKELSERCNVSQPTIGSLENGKNVNIESLIKVADALNKELTLKKKTLPNHYLPNN